MNLYRYWALYRQGYNFYTAFLWSIASEVIIVYRLGIADTSLGHFIPNLFVFTLTAILVTVPINIGLGLFHSDKNRGLAADWHLALLALRQPENRKLLREMYEELKRESQEIRVRVPVYE